MLPFARMWKGYVWDNAQLDMQGKILCRALCLKCDKFCKSCKMKLVHAFIYSLSTQIFLFTEIIVRVLAGMPLAIFSYQKEYSYCLL